MQPLAQSSSVPDRTWSLDLGETMVTWDWMCWSAACSGCQVVSTQLLLSSCGNYLCWSVLCQIKIFNLYLRALYVSQGQKRLLAEKSVSGSWVGICAGLLLVRWHYGRISGQFIMGCSTTQHFLKGAQPVPATSISSETKSKQFIWCPRQGKQFKATLKTQGQWPALPPHWRMILSCSIQCKDPTVTAVTLPSSCLACCASKLGWTKKPTWTRNGQMQATSVYQHAPSNTLCLFESPSD